MKTSPKQLWLLTVLSVVIVITITAFHHQKQSGIKLSTWIARNTLGSLRSVRHMDKGQLFLNDCTKHADLKDWTYLIAKIQPAVDKKVNFLKSGDTQTLKSLLSRAYYGVGDFNLGRKYYLENYKLQLQNLIKETKQNYVSAPAYLLKQIADGFDYLGDYSEAQKVYMRIIANHQPLDLPNWDYQTKLMNSRPTICKSKLISSPPFEKKWVLKLAFSGINFGNKGHKIRMPLEIRKYSHPSYLQSKAIANYYLSFNSKIDRNVSFCEAKTALSILPNDPIVNYHFAEILFNLRLYNSAVAFYNRAMDIATGPQKLAIWEGRILSDYNVSIDCGHRLIYTDKAKIGEVANAYFEKHHSWKGLNSVLFTPDRKKPIYTYFRMTNSFRISEEFGPSINDGPAPKEPPMLILPSKIDGFNF